MWPELGKAVAGTEHTAAVRTATQARSEHREKCLTSPCFPLAGHQCKPEYQGDRSASQLREKRREDGQGLKVLYLFLIAAVTNGHALGDSQEYILISSLPLSMASETHGNCGLKILSGKFQK